MEAAVANGPVENTLIIRSAELAVVRYDPISGKYSNRGDYSRDAFARWEELEQELGEIQDGLQGLHSQEPWWPVLEIHVDADGTTAVIFVCYYQLLEAIMWAWVLTLAR